MTLAAEHDLTQAALAAAVKQRAAELGFDLVGIAPARPSDYGDYFRRWVEEGRGGTMDYLSRRLDERTDVGAFLPGARSIVCVAMNYHVRLEPPPPADGPWQG